MADPVPPNTPADLDATTSSAKDLTTQIGSMDDAVLSSLESFKGLNDQTKIAGDNLDNATGSAQGALNVIDKLTEKIKGYGVSLDQSNRLNKQQSTEMGVLTTALIGTRNAFANLAGVDMSRLNSFSGQWKGMVDAFKNGGGAIGGLIKQAESMAASLGRSVPGAAKSSVGALETFMGTMLKSADNTLKAANAMVQYSAKAGNLSSVFAAAGPHLENMNELVAQQRISLLDTAAAVNLLPEQVEDYYGKLAGLPDALTSTVTASDGMISRSGGNMSKNISLLSATILTAVGAGRDYQDVVNDMTTAFKNYGITGENALKFSANIGKIADDNKVSIDSVKNALYATTNEFGRFANAGDAAAKMSQGLAEATNEYAHALQSAGMSGDRALTVSGGLLQNMAKMDVAQRALLSSRTGGPGGLMGAAQMEKMMRDDPKAALDKMRQMVMRETGGHAVSVDEAATSSAAAAQQARQRALLTSGPFKVADNDQDATRMLDAMSKLGTAGEKDVTKDMSQILGTTMDRGLEVQGQSLTELQQINIATAKMSAAADTTNATLLERVVGGGRDANGNLSAMQQNLRKSVTGAGGLGSGTMNETARQAQKDKAVSTDTAGETMRDQMKGASALIDSLKQMGSKQLEEFKSHSSSIIRELTAKISATTDPTQLADLQRQKLQAERDATAAGTETQNRGRGGVLAGLSYRAPDVAVDQFGDSMPPGQQVGAAARNAAAQMGRARTAGTGDPTAPGTHAGAHGASPQLTLGSVNVNVTATCTHCGNALTNNTPQAQAVTSANRP